MDFLILAFILVIATFNIIGALTMLIIEKKKDIKTLYNLGADQKFIRNIFMQEGFLITSVGAIQWLDNWASYLHCYNNNFI
jgi:lipoprotein-releasing system permease protein